MIAAPQKRLENGKEYNFSCVDFCQFLEDKIAAIFGEIGKFLTKLSAFIMRTIGPVKTGSFFRIVYPAHPSIIPSPSENIGVFHRLQHQFCTPKNTMFLHMIKISTFPDIFLKLFRW